MTIRLYLIRLLRFYIRHENALHPRVIPVS